MSKQAAVLCGLLSWGATVHRQAREAELLPSTHNISFVEDAQTESRGSKPPVCFLKVIA